METTSHENRAGYKIKHTILHALFIIGGLGFCISCLCYIATIAFAITGWFRFGNPTAFDHIVYILCDISKWATIISGIIWCTVFCFDTIDTLRKSPKYGE